ncbi:MAG: hypothetical protein ISQ90_03805 [Rhodospirillales bacterium]|nr:hypothetical protein [Rhodospirillales bacterium]MDC0989589.1 hypothetical protein [Rhodospirillales bacterium]
MQTDLNRDEFLELLEKLSSTKKSDVLSIVEEINNKMSNAGVTWDQLLISSQAEEEEEVEEPDDDEVSNIEDVEESKSQPISKTEITEVKKLIQAIDAISKSDATKQELREYEEDLKEGDFEQMDLQYLRALKDRLSK